MQNIAYDLNNRNDIFETSLMLGTVKDRVKLLMQTGQIALAYMSAKAHNIAEYIPLIEEEMQNRNIKLARDFTDQLNERVYKAKSLLPCRPVFLKDQEYITSNWPVTMLIQSHLQEEMGDQQQHEEEKYYDAVEDHKEKHKEEVKTKVENEGKLETEEMNEIGNIDSGEAIEGNNWGNEIDIDNELLGDIDQNEANIDPDLIDFNIDVNEEQPDVPLDPIKSADPLQKIAYQSQIPAHHILLGNFDDSLELLKKQIGLSNPQVYNDLFELLYSNFKSIATKLPKTFDISTILKSQIEEEKE